MLAIKFRRIGKKHQAAFRLVVAEKKSKLKGRFIEDLGFYNPHSKEANIKKERVLYWIENGAQPTDVAYNLLINKAIIEGKKRMVHKRFKAAPQATHAGGEAAPVAPQENEPATVENKASEVVQDKPMEEKTETSNEETKTETETQKTES